MVQNKGLIYKSIPKGFPVEGQDLVVEARELDLDTDLPKDAVLTKNYYVSFDPYQRGRMRDPAKKSYSPAFALDKPIANFTIAKVLKSNNEKFKEGDIVSGMISIEEYSIVSPELVNTRMKKLDNPYNLNPIVYLGALGMSGLTAYSSVYAICQPKKGETIFVSAASGAVGQIVGQLAKHEGLKVIGSVGSDEKLDLIKTKLKFDDGFNYKKEKTADALKRLAPDGIDIYYDNVGGEQLDSAIAAMNVHGRIAECGMISQYNNVDPSLNYGVKNLNQTISKRIKLQGFLFSDPDFGPKYSADHQKNVAKWISEGSFKTQESITVGIDNGVKAFIGMLKGDNFGKTILQIDELK